jgi:hypothetical protein
MQTMNPTRLMAERLKHWTIGPQARQAAQPALEQHQPAHPALEQHQPAHPALG